MLVVALLGVIATTRLAAGAGGADSRPAADPIALLKCCVTGETLAPAPSGDWVCGDHGVNFSEPWTPLVYAPARRTYLKRGRLPTHWQVQEGNRPDCPRLEPVPSTHTVPYLLFANGSLLVRERGLMLPPERYCADVAAVLVCINVTENEEGAPLPPPPKCCASRQVFDGSRCATAATDEEAASAATLVGAAGALGAGWPACAGGGERYLVVGALAASDLQANGSLRLGGVTLPARGYCAEVVRGERGARVLACETAALAAGVARENRRPGRRHVMYGCALAVGAAFLAATLAGAMLLPAAHRALHWRCQIYYVAALLLADVLLAVTQLAGDTVPPVLCRTIAVCMHFLFLSAFFWLNTMCFNIWWTFRDFRPTSLERGQEACRLRAYMAYAWGGPLLLAGTAALLDQLPPHAAGAFLRPRFAVQRCWFYGDMEILTYFFGPVGVLLLVNLALFVSTTRQLTCGLWRRDDLKSTSERAALGRVCAKLVVVMGVTWAADIVSWAAGGPDYLWYATDLLNALQGVFIFVVVGCQPQVWAGVKRWSVVRAWRGGSGGGGAAAPLHSSSQLPSCGESLTHTTAQTQPAAAAAASHKPPMETVC